MTRMFFQILCFSRFLSALVILGTLAFHSAKFPNAVMFFSLFINLEFAMINE